MDRCWPTAKPGISHLMENSIWKCERTDAKFDQKVNANFGTEFLKLLLGPEKGHYKRGIFTGGTSRISKISEFSRIARKWSDSRLFSTVWGVSRISRISGFSEISRNGLFWKDPFPKDPFFRTRSCLGISNTFFGHAHTHTTKPCLWHSLCDEGPCCWVCLNGMRAEVQILSP